MGWSFERGLAAVFNINKGMCTPAQDGCDILGAVIGKAAARIDGHGTNLIRGFRRWGSLLLMWKVAKVNTGRDGAEPDV